MTTSEPDTGMGLPRVRREQSTMRSNVVDALRDRIVTGTLRPGTRIAEESVSRSMGVSRGPVREALRELENEGLVVSSAYRGTVVSQITVDELRDVLIPIRLIIETHACLRAVAVMTDSDFARLADIVAAMRRAAADNGPDALHRLVELDVQFHAYLTERGGQYHATQIWRLIQPRIRAGFYQLGRRHRELAEIPREHDELLAAIRDRDPVIIGEAMREHIATTPIALLDDPSGPDAADGSAAGGPE